MPPKKAAPSSIIYVVTTAGGIIDSIHASQASAESRVSPAEMEGMIDVDVKTFNLIGGSINITEGSSIVFLRSRLCKAAQEVTNYETLRSVLPYFSTLLLSTERIKLIQRL